MCDSWQVWNGYKQIKKNSHQKSGSTFSNIYEVPNTEDNNKMSLVLFHSQQLNQTLRDTFTVYSESWKYLQHFVVWPGEKALFLKLRRLVVYLED